MDQPGKKTKKATRKKIDGTTNQSSSSEINYLSNNIKSIKIPERFEEKEKLVVSLKSAVGEIDLVMKNFKSKKEYYLEIIEVIEREIKERRDRQLQLNAQSDISIIQEELYNEFGQGGEESEEKNQRKTDQEKELGNLNNFMMSEEMESQSLSEFNNNFRSQSQQINTNIFSNNFSNIQSQNYAESSLDFSYTQKEVKNESNSQLNSVFPNSINNLNKNNLDVVFSQSKVLYDIPEFVPTTYNNFQNQAETIDNYEDFNNFDNDTGFCELNNFQNENDDPNNYNSHNNVSYQTRNNNLNNIQTSSGVKSLSDRYQILSAKNNLNSVKPVLKTSNNINSQPTKVITREFFSSQINSIGHLNSNSVKNSSLVELENKLGMKSESLECPDYDSFSEENLKEEMKKYGLKPSSNKFMVKHLKEIWSFVNMKKLPANLKTELTQFMTKENANSNSNVTSKGGLVSMSKAKSNTINEATKDKIVKAIKENAPLWVKILKFTKLEFKDVKEVLVKKGIILENEIIKNCLLDLGVIFEQHRNN